jgi:hypothetical protein
MGNPGQVGQVNLRRTPTNIGAMRTPDRATRRAEEEGGDMLFVPERRRSRRAPKARSAPSELGERGNKT